MHNRAHLAEEVPKEAVVLAIEVEALVEVEVVGYPVVEVGVESVDFHLTSVSLLFTCIVGICGGCLLGL